MVPFRSRPNIRRLALGLAVGAALLGVAACSGNQGGGNPAVTSAASGVSCPAGPTSSPGTLTASGQQFKGDGLDVTAEASLDPNYGVNGTIDVKVTVLCPTGVTDVSVFQSYQYYGSTVGAHLSELSHDGNTWTFALFADNLSGQEPFQVALYQGALSGSGKPALATIVFKWPASLIKDMAS